MGGEPQSGNDSRSNKLFSFIPRRKLTGRDATLGAVEDDVYAFFAAVKGAGFEWLTIANAGHIAA